MSEQESRHTNREGSFDDLAKGLATGTISRGRALRMLGAALVGGAFASIPGAAWAACKQPFSKCTANTQCCSRRCIKNPQGNGRICGCPTGKTLCPAGNQCVTCTRTGEVVNLTTCKCVCPSGTELCNNACVSNVCSGGRVFNQASCKCECLTGQEVCSGTNACVPSCDPTTGEVLVFDPDTGNCRCECPADTEMCDGKCLAVCTPPKTQRNPNSCACECPTGTQTCGNNCCVSGTECCGGQCLAVCTPPKTQRNPNSCACECPTGTETCGNNCCVQGTECCGGQCLAVCTPPKTQRNPNSCACECPTGTQTCGNNCCAAGTECCGGECRPLCASGEQRNPQSCACEAVTCLTASCGTLPICNDDRDCRCFRTAEGGSFCYEVGSSSCGQDCTSSLECGPGYVCVVNSCCDPDRTSCLEISTTQCASLGTTQVGITAAATGPDEVAGITRFA